MRPLYPHISEVYLLQLMNNLPKDWIITEIIFAIDVDHSIASMTMLQTNQGHTQSDLDGHQGHPVGHSVMGIEIA